MTPQIRLMMTALVLLLSLVTVQTETESQLAAEVGRLIRQLDARQLSQREEAERRLVELGPAVLDLLPGESQTTSAEVSQRLGRVRQKLQRVSAAAVVDASRVTVTGDLPLDKILAAIEEQTGNRIVDARFTPPAVAVPVLHVDFDETPFWPALDEVFDKAGLSIDPYNAQGAVRCVARGEMEFPRRHLASYSGPFRFDPTRIEAVRDLRRAGLTALRLKLEISWEPRLKPITLQVPMANVRAVDDAGNALGVENRQAVLEVPLPSDSIAVPLTIPLPLPGREVREIARLEGSLDVLLPGRTETFRFERLAGAENAAKRIAGVTVSIDRVRTSSGGTMAVFMRIRYDDAKGALASHRTWIYDNPAWLENPQGKQTAYQSYETTRHSENEIGIAYHFAVDGVPADYTFIYTAPGVILLETIDYCLKNIPLP